MGWLALILVIVPGAVAFSLSAWLNRGPVSDLEHGSGRASKGEESCAFHELFGKVESGGVVREDDDSDDRDHYANDEPEDRVCSGLACVGLSCRTEGGRYYEDGDELGQHPGFVGRHS